MSEEKNIKSYTSADIEKYWSGELSTAEMHAIEKTAMDDPFLADALEGYKNRVNAAEDLNALQNKLDKRVTAAATVIPIKQKKFTWIKVAAAVLIISGIGLLVQQLVLNNKNESPIVNVENAEKAKADVAITNEQPKSDISPAANQSLSDTLSFKATAKKPNDIKITSGTSAFLTKDTIRNNDDRVAADIKTESSRDDVALKSSPSIVTANKREESFKEKEALGRTVPDSNRSLNDIKVTAAAKSKAAETFDDRNMNAAAFLNNKFNYRVVDVQNNPVPFANVFNTRDNVGTYTDIKGNFNLVSSDSVLNVQIRSLGYLPNTYKLVPSSQAPALVLKDDNTSRQLMSLNQSVVSNVPRKDTAELEEPEVGWGYYNTYVANNIQIPDNIRKKSTLSNVELSFDIDKTGHPINIKVTKSSQCKECDEEAIRLLKEGPKWKRKGKKSKTSISITVDQK